MGIRIVKAKGGSAAGTVHGFLPYFYAQYRDLDGRNTQKRLETRVRGVPPASGLATDRGDEAFEQARASAERELAALLDELKDPKTTLARGRALIERGTGRQVRDLPLAELAAWYRAREGIETTDANRAWLDWKDSIIADFAEYARHRGVRTVFRVPADMAREYCEGLARTLSHDTLKKKTSRLRNAFGDYLAPTGMDNPFDNGFKARKTADNRGIWHEPLNERQVRAIWAYTEKAAPDWHGVSVGAACTGLRVGDVCRLKWSSVDFKNGIITVKTEKTGATVYVPLFDHDPAGRFYHPLFGEFRRLLEGLFTARDEGEEHVFPHACAVYDGDRSDVYDRGKAIMARALFADEPEDVDPDRPAMTSEEVRQAIAGARWTEAKRARIGETYRRLLIGQDAKQIQAETGVYKSQYCTDLADLEHLTGLELRPRKGRRTLRDLLRRTRQERATGVRSACLYGWHSFRAAFVVLAYTAGVPLDIIKQIVGHTTVEMTMRYLHPTEQDAANKFRDIFAEARRSQQEPAPVQAPALDVAKLQQLLAMFPPEQRMEALKLLQGQAAAPVLPALTA